MADIDYKDNDSKEIDLVELAGNIWQNRKYILKITAIAAVIGLIVGFSIPREYTTEVIMAPEENDSFSASGNMAGLATLAGVNLSDAGGDGINFMLYPDIASSTPFINEIITIPVTDKKKGKTKPLYDYLDNDIKSPWWSAPMAILGKIASIGKEKEDKSAEINPYELTQKQEKIFNALRKRIDIVIDKKTNTISSKVTMQDPMIAAIVSDSLVNKLQEYMINYRTKKAQLDYEFTVKMHEDAREKYYTAQKRYAEFADANKRTALETVNIERQKLQNEQTLAYDVYASMAQQLESAKIKVQEKTPSVTIIEPASVPLRKSNAGKLTYLIAFIFLGALAGTGIVTIKELYLKK